VGIASRQRVALDQRQLVLDTSHAPDKEWSLTACASFVIMKRRHIDEALSVS